MIHNAGVRHACRKLPSAILFGILAFTHVSQARAQSLAPRLAGHYYLQGVTDVGSELLLLPDGRFQWMMSYGAVDQEETGHWTERGKRIELEPDAGGDQPLLAIRNATVWSKEASAALADIRRLADISPAFACSKGQTGITDASGTDPGWGCAIPSSDDGRAGASIVAVHLSVPEPDELNGIGILLEMMDGSQMRAISQKGWLFFPRLENAKVAHISVIREDMARIATVAPDQAMAGDAVFDLGVNLPKLEASVMLPTFTVDGNDLIMDGISGRYVAQ